MPGDALDGEASSAGTPPRRKIGRPITFTGDPDSTDMSDSERRRLKRRVANRESARRVRQKRQEALCDMQARLEAMHARAAALAAALQQAESQCAGLAHQIAGMRAKSAAVAAAGATEDAAHFSSEAAGAAAAAGGGGVTAGSSPVAVAPSPEGPSKLSPLNGGTTAAAASAATTPTAASWPASPGLLSCGGGPSFGGFGGFGGRSGVVTSGDTSLQVASADSSSLTEMAASAAALAAANRSRTTSSVAAVPAAAHAAASHGSNGSVPAAAALPRISVTPAAGTMRLCHAAPAPQQAPAPPTDLWAAPATPPAAPQPAQQCEAVVPGLQPDPLDWLLARAPLGLDCDV